MSNPLPPSLSLLPQNDIHYFIVKQESFFSCSPGTSETRKTGENEAPTGQITARPGFTVAIGALLFVTRGPLLKMAVRCAVEAAMLLGLWGNTAACMRHRLLGQGRREADRLSGSRRGFRLVPITNG